MNTERDFPGGHSNVRLVLLTTRGPFGLYSLNQIPAWISSYIYFKVRDGIIHQFPNFYGTAVEV